MLDSRGFGSKTSSMSLPDLMDRGIFPPLLRFLRMRKWRTCPHFGKIMSEDKLSEITVDVWLYGSLACYGTKAEQGSFANLQVRLPWGSSVTDLLAHLGMRTEERGITFINGELSAMPGLQPDQGHVLEDGDRVGIFDLRSMWPFQYRHGAAMTDEMERAMTGEKDHGLHHTYGKNG